MGSFGNALRRAPELVYTRSNLFESEKNLLARNSLLLDDCRNVTGTVRRDFGSIFDAREPFLKILRICNTVTDFFGAAF